MTLPAARSFCDALRARLDENPDATAFVYVSDRRADVRLTRADVWNLATAHGERMRAAGVRHGDVTLIAVDHGVSQIAVLLGAILAGATPCLFPALAPRLDPGGFAERLRHAVSTLAPRVVISDRPGFVPDAPLAIEATTLLHGPGEALPPSTANQHSVAFLQLSSGSTGRQKAVMITHGALLGLVPARYRGFEVTSSDVVIGWVPLYHDLGLVGSVLAPLVAGIPSILMSPIEWLARPAMLLQGIHRHGATICTLPNFALGYCVRRVRDEELEGVRLDSWRLLAVSAEPIDPDALERFAQRFEPVGFRRHAFVASYGLAEHTLTATTTPPGRPLVVDAVHGSTKRLVGCGFPLEQVEVQVRSDRGVLGDREVGEIFLRSPYLCSGYLHDEETTAAALQGSWLATGDLGYLRDGELFICGRIKDLIIVAGTNVTAEDVEAAAARAPGVKPGRLVAFGVWDARMESEMIVVLAERAGPTDAGNQPADDEIVAGIRAQVRRALEVTPGVVALVPPGTIVKTTSGKAARWATRERWLAGRTAPAAAGGGA